MKKFIYRSAALVIALALFLPMSVCADEPVKASLLPHEREYLVNQLTLCYCDVDLSARVGICAVIFRRMADPRYPDTAAGVIETLRNEGEFISRGQIPDDSARLSADAVMMAESGADPTMGALCFRKIDRKIRGFGETEEKIKGIALGGVEFY